MLKAKHLYCQILKFYFKISFITYLLHLFSLLQHMDFRLKQTNIIFVLGIMIFLTFILFQNVILYAQTTIDGKIGEIKLNR